MFTREKMLEQQQTRPAKRFFRLNRKGCVERAAGTLADLAIQTGEDVHMLDHPHLAPLTPTEKKDARQQAFDLVAKYTVAKAPGTKGVG